MSLGIHSGVVPERFGRDRFTGTGFRGGREGLPNSSEIAERAQSASSSRALGQVETVFNATTWGAAGLRIFSCTRWGARSYCRESLAPARTQHIG